MNAAHWHLALNHIPVVGEFFATCLLAAGLWRRSDELIRASFCALVAVAVLALPVYLTGEPAEVVIMDMADYVDVVVKAHEQAATAAFSAMVFVGLAALGGLIVHRKAVAFPRWLVTTVFGLALVTSSWLAWTANLGGRIHHPEVRPAGVVAE